MKKRTIIIAASLLFTGLLTAFCALAALHFDLSSVDQTHYETNTYILNETFYDLQIETFSADVRLLLSTDGENKVVCEESDAVRHAVDVTDGALCIGVTDSRSWHEKWSVFTARKTGVTVYLTETAFSKLTIKTDTGDVEIPAEFSFTDIEIENDTGDIALRAHSAGNVTITVHTGDVHLDKIAANGIVLRGSTCDVTFADVHCTTLSVEVSTGDVHIKNTLVDGALSLKASTGDMKLTDTVAGGDVTIEASTGNVVLENADGAAFHVKTSTGDVTGTVKSEKIFTASSSSGDVQVPTNSAGGAFEVSTSTGDIHIRVS